MQNEAPNKFLRGKSINSISTNAFIWIEIVSKIEKSSKIIAKIC